MTSGIQGLCSKGSQRALCCVQRTVKNLRKSFAALGVLMALCIVAGAAAPATAPSTDDDAKYTASLEKRVGDILAALKIDDGAKSTNVHDVLIAQYRALRDWQETNQPKLKQKNLSADQKQQIMATRQALHDSFLAKLSELLTPEQVEAVKDKMTYNKVKVTFDAYCAFVPQLTDEQKAKILADLKEAREEAIDGGSAEEKTAIFGKYKGRINNYLASEGIDMKKQEQLFRDRKNGVKPATQPAAFRSTGFQSESVG